MQHFTHVTTCCPDPCLTKSCPLDLASLLDLRHLRRCTILLGFCLGAMQGPAADRHILDWDETDVHSWLSSLGYPQYESQIRGMFFP